MIAKKNSRVDLERKRIVLFQIGLLTAGSFTLAAFNYSAPIKTDLEKKAVAFEPVIYNLEIPTPEKKIEEPMIKPPVQQESSSEPSIDLDNQQLSESISETESTTKLPKPDINISTGLVAVTGEDVDVTGEDLDPFPTTIAEYIGGVVQMKTDIHNNMIYPEIDIQMGNQGTVYVSFIIEKDGSVSNVNIERGVTETIDREAERIVKEFPKWKPAENAYGKVRTIVRLPLRFILE